MQKDTHMLNLEHEIDEQSKPIVNIMMIANFL